MGTVQGMHRVPRGIVRAVGVVLLVGLVTTGARHAFASTPDPSQFCYFGTKTCIAASLTVDTTTGVISGSCANQNIFDQCTIAGTLTGANAIFTITYAGAYGGYTKVNGTLSGTTITGDYVTYPFGYTGSNFTFTGITVIGGTPCIGTSCGTNATPELGSGELLATGLLPLGAVLLYRRRRMRRAIQQEQ